MHKIKKKRKKERKREKKKGRGERREEERGGTGGEHAATFLTNVWNAYLDTETLNNEPPRYPHTSPTHLVSHTWSMG